MEDKIDRLTRELLKDVSLDEVAPRGREHSPAGHWTQAVLLERAAYLRKLAKFGNGSASETMRESPQHSVVLAFQSRTGDAELQHRFSNLIHVLAGGGTLVTGGTMVRARTAAPGEIRGDSIEGGTKQELRAGDVVHVPAGTAHQVLIAGDKSITFLLVRIQESV